MMPEAAHDVYVWPAVTTVAVDLETTSLNRTRDRIIQYGVYGCTPAGHALTATAVVDAETSVGRDPYNLPGVTAHEVRQAVPLRNGHLATLYGLLHGAVVVMHNAAHDWAFLCSEFRRHGHARPRPAAIVCTLHLAKHGVRLPSGGHKLGQVARYLYVPLSQAHNALCDARATFWVWITLVNQFWYRYCRARWRSLFACRSTHFPVPMWREFQQANALWEWHDARDRSVPSLAAFSYQRDSPVGVGAAVSEKM